jgi:hypothetical protein
MEMIVWPRLGSFYWEINMEKNARTLAVMLDALAQVESPHAVFGGLLAMHYGKRLRTGDVDMLVPRTTFGPLRTAFEQRRYEVRQFPFLMRIVPRGEFAPVGDFVMAESTAAVRAAFVARTPAQILGQTVSAVPRGEFVALKFEAAIRSRRRLPKDRRIDVYDIVGVLERGFGPQDERAAARLAREMFPGAVEDLASLLDDLRHGRWPRTVIRAQMRTALLHRQAAIAFRR